MEHRRLGSLPGAPGDAPGATETLLEHRLGTEAMLAFRPGLDAGPWKSL